MSVFRRRITATGPALLLLTAALAGCGGGGGSGTATGSAPASPRASEEEWRALATPRATPLPGAPRVSVAPVELAATPDWPTAPGVDASLAVTELVAAGLLRRQDVDFVERRRFTAAADAERAGRPRAPGAPAAGTSRQARYLVRATWSSVGPLQRLDVRLADVATGEVRARWSGTTDGAADPVSLARAAVAGALATLDSVGTRPTWNDPVPGSAPGTYTSAGIPTQAVSLFVRGLAAEERWRWEEARVGYQAALSAGGATFTEAAAALARTARLRNGGTLGGS